MTKRERNLLIVQQYETGKYSQSEIGTFYNLSQKMVSHILLHRDGWQLEDKPENRGVKSKLSASDLEKLKELLSESSHSSYWTKKTVKKLIFEHFAIDYHPNYIWKLMQKIGFTSQRPSLKDYRQDPEKVKVFKKETIPSIKKNY